MKKTTSPVKLNYPGGEFTISELATLNNLNTTKTHYLVRQLVNDNKLAKVKTLRAGLGRPQNVYVVNVGLNGPNVSVTNMNPSV